MINFKFETLKKLALTYLLSSLPLKAFINE